MEKLQVKEKNSSAWVEPLCSVFGECGGCLYQDIPYEHELSLKRDQLTQLFSEYSSFAGVLVEPVVASPREYHYRHRLDLGFRKTRDGKHLMGFKPEGRRQTIEIDSCAIAREEVSSFLPQLRELAIEKLPPHYKMATLVVKTDDEQKVFWGGIGKRSLRMSEENYFYTEVNGKRVYYALDTFFQANLSILPLLIKKIQSFEILDKDTLFFDLYSGVGLFGICLSDQVGEIIMVEDCKPSVKVAEYNLKYHELKEKVTLCGERVEDSLKLLLTNTKMKKRVAMIDPPRRGLSEEVAQSLCDASRQTRPLGLDYLVYLSCSAESLVRDLKILTEKAYTIHRVIPFDFFPKTRHIETLVLLEAGR